MFIEWRNNAKAIGIRKLRLLSKAYWGMREEWSIGKEVEDSLQELASLVQKRVMFKRFVKRCRP
jgi:hypothetical protein